MNATNRRRPHRPRSLAGPRAPVGLAAAALCLAPGLGEGGMLFRDVTDQTGIAFEHTDGAGGNYHIAETVCAGLALFDYDGDGDVDIYFLNGAYHDRETDDKPRNALYRNEGGWRFTDVTEQAGVGDPHFGLGVAAADYDNDGDADLYLNNYGPNVLYRNDGQGRFTDVTDQAGVRDGDQMGAGANFLDVDGDGDLDLYVSHYVTVRRVLPEPARRVDVPVYLGPGTEIFGKTRDTLYRNNGDGTFSDITVEAGLGDLTGAGMGTICGDYDNDGDTDILVANDMSGNALLANDGSGRFEEIGLLAGMAYDMHGEAQGSMGTELGDYDNDGRLDLYITSYQSQLAMLFRNLGDGSFEDVTSRTGAGVGTVSKVTWGIGLEDFDQDGDRDLFVACGHLQPNIEAYDPRSTYHQRNILFENTGEGTFRDVSAEGGDGLAVLASSRGLGCDDLDHDGDVDIVILNSRGEPTLLRNDTPNPGHWVQFRLQGSDSNRGGVGAQVRVFAGTRMWMDEVHGGRGYQSHFGTTLHFGLGSHSRIDRVEVAWIGGETSTYLNLPTKNRYLLVEGATEPEILPLAAPPPD